MRKTLFALAVLAGTTVSAAAAVHVAPDRVLNVRTGPGLGYAIVDTLDPGEIVTLGQCQGDWCHISHFGPDGWVYGPYLHAVGTVRRYWHDPCDVDPSTEFHMRFGLYHTPLAKYCRERDD